MSTPTAADVRAFFTDETKGAARVEQAATKGKTTVEAVSKCLGPQARGRLAPALVQFYNAKRRKDSRYESGNTGRVQAEAQARADALRAKAVEQGIVKAGSRGPLPKSVLVAEGVIKG